MFEIITILSCTQEMGQMGEIRRIKYYDQQILFESMIFSCGYFWVQFSTTKYQHTACCKWARSITSPATTIRRWTSTCQERTVWDLSPPACTGSSVELPRIAAWACEWQCQLKRNPLWVLLFSWLHRQLQPRRDHQLVLLPLVPWVVMLLPLFLELFLEFYYHLNPSSSLQQLFMCSSTTEIFFLKILVSSLALSWWQAAANHDLNY